MQNYNLPSQVTPEKLIYDWFISKYVKGENRDRSNTDGHTNLEFHSTIPADILVV